MKIKPYDGRHDDQIKTLVELIAHKAAEHAEKGEWSSYTLEHLVDYMDGEVNEMKTAMVSGNLIETLREIGDVGLCLVMIAEKLMRDRTLTPSVIEDVRNRNNGI